MNKKKQESIDDVSAKRYGNTEQQKRIIELGEKGKLTAGKIIELFGEDEKRKGNDEIDRLRIMGLIKFDKNTMDEKRTVYRGTRLIWMHKKGEKMPMDSGEIMHGSLADFMYEREGQFITHYRDCICQKCGIKSKEICCINLECDVSEDDDCNIEYIASPWDMIAMCKKCQEELKKWLNIAVQDPLED
jgi:hypothetical protein